jgi:membrane-associated protease RseP (regulator of RpoE activity)
MLVWLIILGLITYIILQGSIARITQTPIWILWLVMMTPAFIWTSWFLIYGDGRSLPLALVILPFLVCPILYWWLVQIGRPKTRPIETTPTALPSKPAVKLLDQTEEANLRECFPWHIYCISNFEQKPQAVICWGQLRSPPEQAYQTVRKNIQNTFGDRFLLIFQKNPQDKPFFALVPNPRTAENTEQAQQIDRPFLAIGLLLITLFTTTFIGSKEIIGITPVALRDNPQLLWQGLSYSLPLLTILGIHEIAHYLTARAYQMKTTLPYFIPIPLFLGTFGAFISLRSPMPHRKALFDVSIAGPIAGLIVTIPLLLWGLSLSQIVPLTAKSSLLNIHSLNSQHSLLLHLLSKLALGNSLTADTAINLHPIAVAGAIGLVLTALNLMPIGQLDGGHIIHAMFGQNMAVTVGQITRFLMLFLSFAQRDLLILTIILFFLPIYDEPALNDVCELNDARDFLGLLMLAILITIILPTPNIFI